MGIKSDILRLDSPPYEFYELCEYDSDIASTCFRLGTEMAAELAEKQERELIESLQCQGMLLAENALLSEKVATYEQLLHHIQLHADVTMNATAVHQLIVNICDWSYAHRVGNGELSDLEQNEYIKRAFDRLLEIKP